MPKTIYDPNPHMSILDDGQVKKQIADQARRALEMAERRKELPPQTAEEIEAEQFQYESNAYAADHPRYAAARAAAVNFLVLPLEPGGTTPLVDPSEATRDPKRLLAWWAETSDANVGVLLGRIGGIFALRVEDGEAWERLKEMAAVTMRDPDTDRTWTEYRHLGGAHVRFNAPSRPFSVRSRGGWGRDFERAAAELQREALNRNPETFALVWSYPPVQSGQDAFDYRSRTIAAGLRVLGEGEVLPWSGSILEDGIQVAAPMSRPPEVPVWLAKVMGRPRSRKVMAAARSAYDTALRAQEAYWMGIVRAQQEAGERAMREALAERERAATALQEAERA
jgi:Bifunctional DNA primase/polymerase, N-terminal